MEHPLIVQAEYSFMGSNNDELCFKKGDVITVTQREDGGWWEGTLNDKTGWFPSNYVNECKAQLPLAETIRPPEEIQEYRSVVLKDLLDSERAHVAELQGLLENFLEPMQQTQILNQDEYAQLMCNFVEIVRTHEELLIQIEECNDRVGKLFLTSAPLMKKVHQAYCAAHPKAIVILDKYKDDLEKYMERQGAATPGLLVLTTGLSKPFRRLDKYSAMLQELERHMESSHPDRGDTQRSVAVYKDIAATCSATRRQKELELQVLTGPVRGWQGQELSTLGDIIHMGSVAVGADHRDRYFVLFPQTLLILSVSQRMSAFIYEGKLPLTGIIVHRLEDTDAIKNAFEISSPLIDRIVAVCQGPNEANKWVELLNANNPSLPMGIKRQLSNLSNSSMGQLNAAHLSQHLDSRGYCTRFSLCAYYASTPSEGNVHPVRTTLPPSNYPPTAPYANLSAHFARLVRAGGLRSAIVKMLLYPQARQSIDLMRIALRKKRCHKAAAKLKDLNENGESGQSELERQDAIELPTDSESYEDDFDDEYLHSCDSDPFEYVQFYQNKRNDSLCNSTGTFVDHGLPRRHCSSINLIKLDSIDDQEVLAQNELKKESLIIGSRALRAMARKSLNRNSSVHTSTATLELGAGGSITSCVAEEQPKKSFTLQQQSSDASSMYAARLGGAFTACENLASMPDDLSLSQVQREQEATAPLPASPTERHSMPSIFVGNRFNLSKNTEVYVPTWKDRQEMQNQSVEAEPEDGVHSSSLDLPAACRTAPDKMQAELLYNYDEALASLENPLQLQRETLPFQSHNLNSDKRVSHKSDSPASGKPQRESSQAARSSSTTELCIDTASKKRDAAAEHSRDSIRRCISYQFLQMSNRPPPPNPPRRDPDLHLHSKCRCCESSQCPSPRSSDSGMAGSCTIASPDPPNPESYFPMCATGQDVLDDSGKSGERFDVCGMFRDKFLTPEATQEEAEPVEELAEEPTTPTNQKATQEEASIVSTTQIQVNARSIYLPCSASMDETHTTSATDPLVSSSSVGELDTAPRATFRSGMYAHWWKKERLPPEVVRGIAHAYNKSLPSVHDSSKDSKDSGSVCSSCFCSLGASGYSEGTLYCSVCQNCVDYYNGSTTSTTNTTTTTASSSSGCPLCSEDEASARLSAARGAYASEPAYSSSLDCPICAARVSFAGEEDVAAIEPQPAAAASTGRRPSAGASRSFGQQSAGLSGRQLDVTTQTEPVVQPSPELQPVHAHSASTTSSASATTTKSTKSSGGGRPQIKFSPDTKQQDSSPGTSGGSHGRQPGGTAGSSGSGSNGGAKRKERKHKG
ncbi:pneumococcal serine-rich repeat protein isoform X1 [Drosophila subobscura]|uniref:pneumococcal serine-rich repeat protein isoform X1 n=1 Tax=Drosophila subobscura TaxID=7241 RepID=UPI00155B02C1|nr:pneumococcal serine-rich repeat protein isoform X1 [Drosophila subobscura]XP_034667979.1 pneumococcal serine-rich repeat protein isoform X1 [Drosophila subobscura]XP_034667981.1 pneumococcal serine-rich repeat protein isoform X1 [Drosophila subobscura]